MTFRPAEVLHLEESFEEVLFPCRRNISMLFYLSFATPRSSNLEGKEIRCIACIVTESC